MLAGGQKQSAAPDLGSMSNDFILASSCRGAVSCRAVDSTADPALLLTEARSVTVLQSAV